MGQPGSKMSFKTGIEISKPYFIRNTAISHGAIFGAGLRGFMAGLHMNVWIGGQIELEMFTFLHGLDFYGLTITEIAMGAMEMFESEAEFVRATDDAGDGQGTDGLIPGPGRHRPEDDPDPATSGINNQGNGFRRRGKGGTGGDIGWEPPPYAIVVMPVGMDGEKTIITKLPLQRDNSYHMHCWGGQKPIVWIIPQDAVANETYTPTQAYDLVLLSNELELDIWNKADPLKTQVDAIQPLLVGLKGGDLTEWPKWDHIQEQAPVYKWLAR